MTSSKTSNDPTTLYAQKVVDGDIIASNMNRMAAQRHLNDMARQNTEDFPFYFDLDSAARIIRFMELMKDPKTGKPMQLALFQKFILGSTYGWKRMEDGGKRFKKSYISLARKNGKSIISAGEALFEMLYGTEPAFGRQIYCTANAKDQARIVWEMIRKQLQSIRSESKHIYKTTKITQSKNLLMNLKDESYIKPLSKDTGKLDGFEPYFAILDEYHEAKDDDMIEVLRSGQILLKDRMLTIISTAGFNLNGPMYKEYVYCKQLLRGELTDDEYFVYCAEMDSKDEVDDESLWIKANPLLEVEEIRDIIMKNIKNDMQESVAKGSTHKILTKNFNIWQSSSSDSLIDVDDWERLALKEFDPHGREVYIGIDLSRMDDLTGIGLIYPVNGEYVIDSHAFVATKGGLEAKMTRDKIDYEKLAAEGRVTLTRSTFGIIDYEQVVEWLQDYISTHNLDVKAVCYDPWHAQSLLTKVEQLQLEWPLIEVPQNFRVMSQPIKDFRLAVYQDEIKHLSNPVLDIGVHNAVIIRDKEGNEKIDKGKYREKIDTIVSVLIAWTEARMHEFQTDWNSVYDSEDFGF